MSSLPNLPRGWEWATVREVGEVKLGRQRSPEHHDGPNMRPYLRVANVYDARLDLTDVLKMNFTPSEFETFQLRPGDVLINEGQSLEWVGRSAIYRGEVPGACFQNTLIRFRAKPLILPEFALLVFRHYVFSQRFRRIAKWTTNIAHLGAERFAEVEFPVPPMNEQRRIVAEADKQLTRLDAGVEALRRLQAQLKRYRASVLKAACEGLVGRRRPHSAFRRDKWRPLSELVRTLDQGWSPRCEQERATDDSEWAVIKTTAIQSMSFFEMENKRLPATLAPRPSLAIQAGDVLITRAGPRSRVGICCLVRQVRPRLMLCDKAYRIRPTAELLGPFLEMLLASPRLVDELENLKSGISDSGVNLTQDRFLQLRLPVPPLSEQRLILDSVAARLSVIGSIESICRTTHQRAARLRQAVLSSAFAGSLVPQDPNDEPASKLLERISTSGENKPLPKQVRAKQATAVPKMKATR